MTETKRNETVSVVIPTHYRNERLHGAIESCLHQEYRPLEIVVVDDSGAEHAKPVVEEFDDVTYIPLPENRGAQAARNVGVDASSGSYVQLLDDDDRLLDDKLTKQVDVFREHDDVGVVYCGLTWENGPTVSPDPRVRGDVLEDALKFQTSPCAMGTMLIRRNVLEEILPLKHRHGADDIGMKIELARVTAFEFVDEALLWRGNPDASVGTSMAAVEGRKRILEMYSDLYGEYPERVRRWALAETYLVEGQLLLEARLWSLDAIVSFARACYHVPGLQLPYLGSLLASLLGRPGHALSRHIYSKYVLGEDRAGKTT